MGMKTDSNEMGDMTKMAAICDKNLSKFISPEQINQ